MNRWRLPVRIARREAMRAKGRTVLMLVMIALPVLGVTAADVLIQTQDVNSAESLDRRIGTEAAARVSIEGSGVGALRQSRDPDTGTVDSASGYSEAEATVKKPTLAQVLGVLGGDRRGITMDRVDVEVKSDRGVVYAGGTEVDLRDPLAGGLYRLTSGRRPQAVGEVVVNQALADRGPGVGETLTVSPFGGNGQTEPVTLSVVGIAESTSVRSWEQLFSFPGSLARPEDFGRSWLISGPPVRWDSVEKLNALGALVLSRAEILDPSPAALAADAEFSYESGIDEATITIAILVAVMALIEVVLLAGPAFAVGARRQARPLALLSACGGTPAQARRVVLATGVVIGTVGSVAGVVLGIGTAAAIEPVVQRFNGSWFGPFEVPWWHLLGIAGFGFVSALLAAVVPAWIASRQDVVAVLAGRRGDRKPSARSPYVGLVLLGLATASAWAGTRSASTTSAILIGICAILAVFGMLFVVPVVVVGVSRLGRRMPLALRFAVRDAARHRTRTTPAVAAVAATVAGVVALGIGVTSSEAMDADRYQPVLAMGTASISADSSGSTTQPPWADYAAAVVAEAPDAVTEQVLGIPYSYDEDVSTSISFSRPGGDADSLESFLSGGYGGSYNAEVLVYDGSLPDLVTAIDGFPVDAATTVLEAGGAVVFADGAQDLPRVAVHVATYDNNTGESASDVVRTVPAAVAVVGRGYAPVSGIIAKPLAAELRLEPSVIGLSVTGSTLSKSQEKDVQEALNAFDVRGSLYVERGYQTDSSTFIIQLVLAGLGAVLMLGGTLTATFLALSDARPDLATLSAVGATPRMRRGVAAGYALAVGGVGAVLGVLVGFVPGVAATYPLTAASWSGCYGPQCPPADQHYLDVPWLMIGGLVVVLPLLVAGVVWVSARSRLPLVARLS